MSLISPKSEPTLAVMDCAGEPARSTACATVLVAEPVTPVTDANQNKNMTTVTPNEDQKAIC